MKFNMYRTSAVGTKKKGPTRITVKVVGTEKEATNTYHKKSGWNGKSLTDRSYVEKRNQNHTNTNWYSEKNG